MPKRSTEDYDNDDGFVEDAPIAKSSSSKKQKTSSSSTTTTSAEKGNGSLPGGGQVGKDGEYWEISGKRRLQLSLFNGKQMVNIREYYEKEGEMLPGKKERRMRGNEKGKGEGEANGQQGISLTMEQFDTIVALLPHVEIVLKGKGCVLKRPDYGSGGNGGGEGEGEGDEEEKEKEDEHEEEMMDGDDDGEEDYQEDVEGNGKGKGRKAREKGKKNFEDTSEDE